MATIDQCHVCKYYIDPSGGIKHEDGLGKQVISHMKCFTVWTEHGCLPSNQQRLQDAVRLLRTGAQQPSVCQTQPSENPQQLLLDKIDRWKRARLKSNPQPRILDRSQLNAVELKKRQMYEQNNVLPSQEKAEVQEQQEQYCEQGMQEPLVEDLEVDQALYEQVFGLNNNYEKQPLQLSEIVEPESKRWESLLETQEKLITELKEQLAELKKQEQFQASQKEQILQGQQDFERLQGQVQELRRQLDKQLHRQQSRTSSDGVHRIKEVVKTDSGNTKIFFEFEEEFEVLASGRVAGPFKALLPIQKTKKNAPSHFEVAGLLKKPEEVFKCWEKNIKVATETADLNGALKLLESSRGQFCSSFSFNKQRSLIACRSIAQQMGNQELFCLFEREIQQNILLSLQSPRRFCV